MANELKLFTDGTVKTNNREFTRLIGGFGDNKPMFTIFQAGELLGLRTSDIRDNLKRNESEFENNIDVIDLKSANVSNGSEINIDITKFLKDIGYSQNKLNATKKWLAFSFSGMMKLVKISTTKESWYIYNNFLEDYFKTKAENQILKITLEEEIEKLKKDRAMFLGMSIMEMDINEKVKLSTKSEELNNRIIELEKRLTENLTKEKYKRIVDKYHQFLDSNGCCSFEDTAKILNTNAKENGIKLKVSKITLPRILREKGILSKNKIGKSYKNLPNKNYEEYFNVTIIPINEEVSRTQTKINSKGIDFIYDLLIKQAA